MGFPAHYVYLFILLYMRKVSRVSGLDDDITMWSTLRNVLSVREIRSEVDIVVAGDSM